jgi:hypothetical protein
VSRAETFLRSSEKRVALPAAASAVRCRQGLDNRSISRRGYVAIPMTTSQQWKAHDCRVYALVSCTFPDEQRCQSIRCKVGEPCTVIAAAITNPARAKPLIPTLGEIAPVLPGPVEAPWPVEEPWYSQIVPPLELVHEPTRYRIDCREIDMLEVLDSVVVFFYVRFPVEELEQLQGEELWVRSLRNRAELSAPADRPRE